MNQVAIEVKENIDQYIDRVLHYDSYGVEYLMGKDKMIEAVMKDK